MPTDFDADRARHPGQIVSVNELPGPVRDRSHCILRHVPTCEGQDAAQNMAIGFAGLPVPRTIFSGSAISMNS